MKMLHRLLLFVLLTNPFSGITALGQSHTLGTSAGIYQLVEKRAGRTSCWGIVIQLARTRFKRTISKEQIEIRDGKYSRDLREIMNWRTERSRRRLIIKFKPGMGDFDTGDRVEIRINRSAFAGPMTSGNNYFTWVIDTDVL